MAQKSKPSMLTGVGGSSPVTAVAAQQVADPSEIHDMVAALRGFDYGQNIVPWSNLEALLNSPHGQGEVRASLEAELVRLLEAKPSVACQQEVCRRLWLIGTEASVGVLEKMLADSDVHVVEAACYALSRHPSPAADRALHKALNRAQGEALVAVIHLLGDRRAAASAAQLAELAEGSRGATAEAAIAALGKISTGEAVAALRKLHAAGEAKGSAAHALLQSAQELTKQGKTADAKGILAQLVGPSDPPHIRRGASLALKQLG